MGEKNKKKCIDNVIYVSYNNSCTAKVRFRKEYYIE